MNPNRSGSGVFFVGAADWGWGPSTPDVERQRMSLLGRLRDWEPRFRLLFPHPTPETAKKLDRSLKLLQNWLVRSGKTTDHSVPQYIPQAVDKLRAAVAQLRNLTELLPEDEWPVRLVVDTNALIDNPDLAAYTAEAGTRYIAHLLPVVLREVDDHKRGGRTPELREAAKKADRRLKGLRSNGGDVTRGVRVAGGVHVVFEHIEPKSDALPVWLDLDVPDDRFVASTLLLQSRHPGSAWYVVTSDLNLQTKLAAVSLPFIEP
ncbi:PIN domain-containing protein [Kitasatospora sp. NPDC048407]|uniref:PIN domain-containing protein n=1 Tax=Kitasatospora sp. NPDC048407 TaxID=3364051 RepID=UPI003720C623